MGVSGVGSVATSIVANYRSTAREQINSFSKDLRKFMTQAKVSDITPKTKAAVKDKKSYEKAESFEREQMRSHIKSVKSQLHKDVNRIISEVEMQLIDSEEAPDKIESICNKAENDLKNYFMQKRTTLHNSMRGKLNGYSQQLVQETVSMVYEG